MTTESLKIKIGKICKEWEVYLYRAYGKRYAKVEFSF